MPIFPINWRHCMNKNESVAIDAFLTFYKFYVQWRRRQVWTNLFTSFYITGFSNKGQYVAIAPRRWEVSYWFPEAFRCL